MDEERQTILALLRTSALRESSQRLLALPADTPPSFFVPLFDAINALERIALLRELIAAAHPLAQHATRVARCFVCLRSSEHGVILEEIELEKAQIVLGVLGKEERIAIVELLPYNVVEKLLPILTESEKATLGLNDPNSSTSKKCSCQ